MDPQKHEKAAKVIFKRLSTMKTYLGNLSPSIRCNSSSATYTDEVLKELPDLLATSRLSPSTPLDLFKCNF